MRIIISILLSVCCIPLFAGSIQVSAATEKQVAPDQATLSVQFKLIANSSSQAKQQVNQQVNQLFSKLEFSSNKIER